MGKIHDIKDNLIKIYKNFFFCLELVAKSNVLNFICLISMKVISVICTFLTLYLGKKIINDIYLIIKNQSSVYEIYRIIILYFVCICGNKVIQDCTNKISKLQIDNMLTYLNISIMKNSSDIDISYFDIPEKFDQMSHSRQNVHSFHQIVFMTINTFTNCITLVLNCIILLRYNPLLIALSFIIMIPKYRCIKKVSLQDYEFEKTMFRDYRRREYLYSLFFTKTASIEMKTYHANKLFGEKFHKTSEEIMGREVAHMQDKGRILYLYNLPGLCLGIGVKVWIVVDILLNKLSIGDFTYITGIFDNLISSLDKVIQDIGVYEGYSMKIDDYKKYFLLCEDKLKSGDKSINSLESIRFKHVSFQYPGEEKYVIKDMNLEIGKNEKIALVGINGSGKSTLIKLLLRFYDPTEGEIYVNGENVKNYDLQSYRKLFSSVFQDFNTYSFKIRENIALSNIVNMDQDDEIQAALSKAKFNNSKYKLDNNIDVYIGKEYAEDGLELSGGQKQQLAIARGIFRNCDMMIMDEPSSSLDPEIEHYIMQSYEKNNNGKAVILVTHNLYNVTEQYKIFVIQDGCNVGCGIHKELMKENVVYRELYMHQYNQYQLSDA